MVRLAGEVKDTNAETQNSKFALHGLGIFDFRFSNSDFRASKWIARLAVGFAGVAFSSVACAQGCAMCYNTAAAAKAAAIRALQSGILILLVPPILMFIGIFALAFRSRERSSDPVPQDSDLDRELTELLASVDSTGESDLETLDAEIHSPVASARRLPRATGWERNQRKP